MKTSNPSIFVDVTEQRRLNEARENGIPWKKWGPYLSERQWGTVREDYSADGNAWDYFTPRPGALARLSLGRGRPRPASRDDQQRLCFALALWNGSDPILKERLFGLTNSEGNHGEDVKEYYFYLDSHADALVHEVPLQVSAGASSRTRDLVETNRAPRPAGVRVRAARHRRLRRRPLLRRLRRVRQGRPRRHPDPDHGRTTAARSRPRCTCCRRCGSATRGRGAAEAPKPVAARGRRRRHRGVAPRARRLHARAATARPSCCSPRTRQRRAAVGPAERARRT